MCSEFLLPDSVVREPRVSILPSVEQHGGINSERSWHSRAAGVLIRNGQRPHFGAVTDHHGVIPQSGSNSEQDIAFVMPDPDTLRDDLRALRRRDGDAGARQKRVLAVADGDVLDDSALVVEDERDAPVLRSDRIRTEVEHAAERPGVRGRGEE